MELRHGACVIYCEDVIDCSDVECPSNEDMAYFICKYEYFDRKEIYSDFRDPF